MEKKIVSVNDQTIDKIEHYASLFMPVDAIAVLLGIDEWLLRETLDDDTHALTIAYRRGKALSMLDLREKNQRLIDEGSTEALAQMSQFLSDMNASEL